MISHTNLIVAFKLMRNVKECLKKAGEIQPHHAHNLALPVDIERGGFAECLRLLRKERGLTQTLLAKLIGMPARSYNR